MGQATVPECECINMDEQKLKQLENETNVVGSIADVLKYGSFPGHLCERVAIGLMYMQGLHKNLQAAVKAAKEELAPVAAPVAPVVTPAVANDKA